ncbi:hypothetical protein JCM19232_4236 [Vibrio ishigakensis]|uniref:DUF4402 domain-containing protein n=1 Tax=Vibrio ishigakensis TaxID=1481914 RepID=A0A0B8PG13_9VIBR|nr:hypothetical protein JCM19232_4236 [Vibrio ishigakensis]
MFKSKIFLATVAVLVAPSVFAGTEVLTTVVDMTGKVTGTGGGTDITVVEAVTGRLEADTLGAFTTLTPTTLEVAHGTAPGANPMTDVAITLDTVQVSIDGAYDPAATVEVSANGTPLVKGTEQLILDGGSQNVVPIDIASTGAISAGVASPGQVIATSASFTINATF